MWDVEFENKLFICLCAVKEYIYCIWCKKYINHIGDRKKNDRIIKFYSKKNHFRADFIQYYDVGIIFSGSKVYMVHNNKKKYNLNIIISLVYNTSTLN